MTDLSACTIERFDMRHVGNTEFGRSRYSREHEKMQRRRTAKVYVSPKGDTVLSQLFDRHDRPHKLYREIVKDRVEKELRDAGLLPEGQKFGMRWSQYCGCSCPCSPGFIVSGTTTGVDIYIGVDAPRNNSEANEETV